MTDSEKRVSLIGKIEVIKPNIPVIKFPLAEYGMRGSIDANGKLQILSFDLIDRGANVSNELNQWLAIKERASMLTQPLIKTDQFTIVADADETWSRTRSHDPKVTGVTIHCSAHKMPSAQACQIRETYGSKEEADAACKELLAYNPHGHYAVCPIVEAVTLTIPASRLAEFIARAHDPKKDGRRWGQAFHQMMDLEKITSFPNKTWCDQLYNEPDAKKAFSMVLCVLDHDN